MRYADGRVMTGGSVCGDIWWRAVFKFATSKQRSSSRAMTVIKRRPKGVSLYDISFSRCFPDSRLNSDPHDFYGTGRNLRMPLSPLAVASFSSSVLLQVFQYI